MKSALSREYRVLSAISGFNLKNTIHNTRYTILIIKNYVGRPNRENQ